MGQKVNYLQFFLEFITDILFIKCRFFVRRCLKTGHYRIQFAQVKRTKILPKYICSSYRITTFLSKYEEIATISCNVYCQTFLHHTDRADSIAFQYIGVDWYQYFYLVTILYRVDTVIANKIETEHQNSKLSPSKWAIPIRCISTGITLIWVESPNLTSKQQRMSILPL